MEENSTLFSLSIDPATKVNLSETARWARFLAIVGFVFLAFLVFTGVYISVTLSRYEMMYDRGASMGYMGTGVAVVYLISAAIAFFPLLFTLRFANQMRSALDGNDQNLLNASFENLKGCFRYLGIVTIVCLSLMVLSLVFSLAGLALN